MKLRRWTARILVACMVAAAPVVGVTSPAQAALWQLNDGFEGDLWTRWSCWQTIEENRNACGRSMSGAGPLSPRSGTQTGRLFVALGWSDIGRTVRLSPFTAGRTLRCGAGVYGKNVIGNQVSGQLEVIDVETWTYIAVKPFTLTAANGGTWHLLATGSWIPPSRDVFVRVGLIGQPDEDFDTLQVDDMVVQCQFF